MSIKLPQYTLQETTQKPTKLKKILLPLLVVIAFFAGFVGRGYYVGDSINTLRLRNAILEDTNSDIQDMIVQNETEISLLKTEKKIKNEAVLQLQNTYKKLIDAQNNLKSDINFYERLLSPNPENKGLRVFETNLTQQDNTFYLKVILVQKIERANLISGKYQINLIGKTDGKFKSIQINDTNNSSFSFKYFENISLMFSLPEGFIAEQLVVKLLPKNKKSKTIEYTVDWKSLKHKAEQDHV